MFFQICLTIFNSAASTWRLLHRCGVLEVSKSRIEAQDGKTKEYTGAMGVDGRGTMGKDGECPLEMLDDPPGWLGKCGKPQSVVRVSICCIPPIDWYEQSGKWWLKHTETSRAPVEFIKGTCHGDFLRAYNYYPWLRRGFSPSISSKFASALKRSWWFLDFCTALSTFDLQDPLSRLYSSLFLHDLHVITHHRSLWIPTTCRYDPSFPRHSERRRPAKSGSVLETQFEKGF